MSITNSEAIGKFVEYARQYDKTAPNKNWYVGISENPANRKKQHELGKGIFCQYFKTLVVCSNRNDAMKIEDLLEKKGFAKTKEDLIAMESNTVDEKVGVYIFRAVKRAKIGGR